MPIFTKFFVKSSFKKLLLGPASRNFYESLVCLASRKAQTLNKQNLIEGQMGLTEYILRGFPSLAGLIGEFKGIFNCLTGLAIPAWPGQNACFNMKPYRK
jgi:hypothetical protein